MGPTRRVNQTTKSQDRCSVPAALFVQVGTLAWFTGSGRLHDFHIRGMAGEVAHRPDAA